MLRISLILLAAFMTLLAPARAGQTTTINPDQNWGHWEGWGTSLCWWAKIFGDRDDLADAFFTLRTVDLNGQSLPGLGLNFARYNAGACSWNEVNGQKMAVSPIIRKSRQIEGFWLNGESDDPQSPSWDWSVDANQRAMLLKARDRGANHFELFSNSPMWWMCANLNPSGAAKATHDNLLPENYRKHAVYMAAVAKQAKDQWGLTFTSVEPLNEPFTNFWAANGKQEGCHFSHEAQAEVIKLTRAELDKRGLKDMILAASDETHYDLAISTWYSFNEKDKATIGRVNVHGYQGSKGRRDVLYDAVVKAGKKPLWNTEYGGPEPTGLDMASHLNLDLRFLHPTAWAYWQPLDLGGWGLILSDLEKKTIGEAAPKYYVLAQYSRHIRPGMMILDTGETDTVAAYDAAARKLVIVTLNRGAACEKSFDLSKFADVKGPVTGWTTEPRATARYEVRRDLPLVAKRLDVALPADSIQTFEVENAMTAP
jgi:galactan endo-1,6-beta-galactosidase